METTADFKEEQDATGPVIRFTGRLTLARISAVADRLDALETLPATIDLGDVERIDTVGAWVIHKLMQRSGATLARASDEARRLIDLVDETKIGTRVKEPPLNPFVRVLDEIGDATVTAFSTLTGLMGFLGQIIIAFWDTMRHPSRFRMNAVIQRFELVGVRALGIIGLMSFLIGIVIAQQGAVQLAEFGAADMTVNLVGRLTMRELGVLMTAIMVAGRSGSAFAAQLGTMKLTEEIDAMRTIGVSPIEALVLPRIIAAVLMMPLLGFYSSLVGITGGGLFCWISLDMPPETYIIKLQDVIPITDIWVGMTKAPVFGLIIALTGCYQGLQVKGNAEEVGLRTTAAVVQAIFLVIVLDAFFAVFFSNVVHWD